MDYIREAIEYLKSYKDLQMAVINLKEEIQKLDAELKGSAITYKDMPGGSGALQSDDVMLNKLFRLQQCKLKYAESYREIKRIDRILEGLSEGEGNEKHTAILKRTFIDGGDIDVIADELGYSRRQYYRVRNVALRRFAVQLFGIAVIK